MTNYKKALQHKFLKYEDVKNDTLYAITLNPRDDSQYWAHNERISEFTKFHNNYLKKLNRLSPFLIQIYLEISPSGRLHYHGTIKLFDKDKFYINTIKLLQMEYSYEIDTLSDDEGATWHQYCIKQNFSNTNQKYIPDICISPLKVGLDFKQLTKDFFTKTNINDI